MFTVVGLEEISKLSGFGLGGTQFDAIALGAGATAPALGDTLLQTEITLNGAGRKSGVDVTTTEITTAFTNDTARLNAVWQITASQTINEVGVFNSPTANTGILLLRQVFVAPLNLVAQDVLELTIDIQASDQNPAGLTRLTNTGIVEGNRRIYTDLTETNAGIKAIALGLDDGTTLPLDATNVALGNEIVAADNFGLARGQETVGPTVSLFTTNSTNDTTRVESTWVVAAGASPFVGVNELGVFDLETETSGIMWIRYTFADPYNLVPTDVVSFEVRLVNVQA